MVDIAAHGAGHRAYGAQPAQGVEVADVARVPQLVAAAQVEGVAVVPAGVGVAQDADAPHQMPIFLAIALGTAALLT